MAMASTAGRAGAQPVTRRDGAGHRTRSRPTSTTAVPPQSAASWKQAEARLYLAALTERPDLYQRVVRLVGATADHLRLLGPGTGALVAAAARGPELVAGPRGDDSGHPVDELDPTSSRDAALALRYRELGAEQAAPRRLAALDRGGAAGGEAWVVVEESGEPAGDPFLPYRRLEVGRRHRPRRCWSPRPRTTSTAAVVHPVDALRVDLGDRGGRRELERPGPSHRRSPGRSAPGRPRRRARGHASEPLDRGSAHVPTVSHSEREVSDAYACSTKGTHDL